MNKLNDCSVTHLKYSFSKSERFPQIKLYCREQYSLPNLQSNRFASLGYGERKVFQDTQKVPGPGQYNLKNLNNQYQGTKIGLGREEVICGSYLSQNKVKIGPGDYNSINETFSKKTPIFFGRPKSGKKEQTPGPGNYDQPSFLNAQGKYALSTVENSFISIFNPPSSQRFIEIPENKRTPGSGKYNQNLFNQKGQVILSTCKTPQQSSFQHQKREVFKITNLSPGPGMYDLGSAFKK